MIKTPLLLSLALLLFATWPVFAQTIGKMSASGPLLESLPDNNGLVIVDPQRLVSSEVWTNLSAGEHRLALETFKTTFARVGLEIEKLTAAALSVTDIRGANYVAAASGPFNPTEILSRLRSDPNIKLETEKYKEVDIHTLSSGTPSQKELPLSFAFPASGMILISNAAGVRSAIEVRAGLKPSIARNQKLTAAVAQLPESAVRFAISVTPSQTSWLRSNSIPLPDFSSINLIFGAVDFTSSIGLNLTLRTNSAKDAEVMANQLNGLMSMLKGFFGSSTDPRIVQIMTAVQTISITAGDTDVKISGSLPKELLPRLLPVFRRKT